MAEADFVLSIGTSKDWQLAMEEGGANEIRIGTDIFGAREYRVKAVESEVEEKPIFESLGEPILEKP